MSFNFTGNKNVPVKISDLRTFSALANDKTINLGIGKPYIDTPVEIKEIALDVLKSNKALDYSENKGNKNLRSAMALLYNGKSDDFIVTNGAQEALYNALTAIVSYQEEVLIPDPGFLAYKPMIEMLGAYSRTYKLVKKNSQFFYDPEEILKKVSAKTKAVIVSKVSNPTGSDFSLDAFKFLADQLRRKNVVLISDEVYGEFHFAEEYSPFYLHAENIVSINSLSKSHAMTGWRIGFAATKNEMIQKKILVAHQYATTCVNHFTQHVAEVLYSDRSLYQKIALRFKMEYLENLNLFCQANFLPRPCGGFYMFIPINNGAGDDVAYATDLLKRKNILVIPGSYFGEEGRGFIRVALSVNKEIMNKILKEIL